MNSSDGMVGRSAPLGKGKMLLKYTLIIEVDKQNYFEGEDPVQVEQENLKQGSISFDELAELAVSVEVEVYEKGTI